MFDKEKNMKTWEISGNLSEIENYETFLYWIAQVYSFFCIIFGEEIMTNIDLYIDNAVGKETTGDTPVITPILKKYLLIKLGVEDFSNIEQIVYQISHELCHYVVYSIKGIDKPKATIKEENICSAMSLVVINRFFPKSTQRCLEYVRGLKDERYNGGAKIAEDISFDIIKLKELIYKL